MKSSKYVWWVGGLAVALLAWAWLASVPWPASSDPANESWPDLSTRDSGASAQFPNTIWTGVIAPVKNGPDLGGYGAHAVKDAIAAKITSLPHALG